MFGNRGPKRRGPKRRSGRSQFDREEPSGSVLETVIGLASRKRPVALASTDSRSRLVDLAIEPLALVHAVSQPEATFDADRLRTRWSELRGAFEETAKRLRHRESDVQAAVYALSVALDEAVMRHPERIGEWLQAGALQLEFHEQRELVGGKRFYEKLDELRQKRETAIDALEIYDACLALGYRGRFVTDPAGRDALRAQVLADVSAVRGEPSRTLAPNAARMDERTGETIKRIPRWVAPVVLAGAVLLSWLTVLLFAFLHARGVAATLAKM